MALVNGGGFASGLASGLSNGFALANEYQRGRIAREAEERAKAIREAMANGDGLTPISTGQPASPQSLQPADNAGGLQPITTPASATMQPAGDGTSPDAAQAQPVASAEVSPPRALDQSPGLPPVQAAVASAPTPAAAAVAPTPAGAPGLAPIAGSAKPVSPAAPAARPVDPLGGGEFGELADSLTRGYRAALKVGEPYQALQLLAQREKLIGMHRGQAYSDALNRYQLTGDPNAFVPLVNRFGPNGIHINSIETLREQAGGQPMYMLHYSDPNTGKDVAEPLSYGKLQSVISGIADPSAQRALVAQRANDLWNLSLEQRKKKIGTDAKVDEVRRTEPIRTQGRIAVINATGDQARQTAEVTATVGKKNADPAEVATANWLVRNGVAKDATEAWGLVHGSRTKSRQDFVADFSKQILKSQDPLSATRLTPQEAVRQADELWASLQKGNADARPAQSSLSAPAVGSVEGGWRFKGGDPADKANWERE